MYTVMAVTFGVAAALLVLMFLLMIARFLRRDE